MLVRETALNAARAVRSKIDGYRHFFEERDTYLLGIVLNHINKASVKSLKWGRVWVRFSNWYFEDALWLAETVSISLKAFLSALLAYCSKHYKIQFVNWSIKTIHLKNIARRYFNPRAMPNLSSLPSFKNVQCPKSAQILARWPTLFSQGTLVQEYSFRMFIFDEYLWSLIF